MTFDFSMQIWGANASWHDEPYNKIFFTVKFGA